MVKKLVEILGIMALMSIPKTISNPEIKTTFQYIQKKDKIEIVQENPIKIDLTSSRDYLRELNAEIELYLIKRDFIQNRLDSFTYTKEREEFYNETLKECKKNIYNLSHKKDSVYKFIRDNK